ncbi:hypothetical protein F4778DRAFT_279919 [Xylariomycetidae sp. FL2044]|nr:hypothetical protein F4778DRAFT_279919 [Xylariomycetidae sp. FL2044]
MPRILLFVTAKAASPEAVRVMDKRNRKPYFLVESREVDAPGNPRDQSIFKSEIKDGDEIASKFIGAHDDECQSWALQQMDRFKFIEQNIIAILDQQSSRDHSLLIKYYHHGPGFEFPDFDGPLPNKPGEWHAFRVRYDDVFQLQADLMFCAPDVTFPVYFGRKEELTDGNGVFDVKRANRIAIGEE